MINFDFGYPSANSLIYFLIEVSLIPLIMSAIIPTSATIDLHFYSIWKDASIVEWLGQRKLVMLLVIELSPSRV